MQNLYQRFQPAQFNNYTAPKRSPMRGAVRDNITFAHIAKTPQQTDNSSDKPKRRPPPPPPPKPNQKTPKNNDLASKPKLHWADEPIDDFMETEVLPTPKLQGGTAKGGSMHDPDFKQLVTSQLTTISNTLTDLCVEFKFTQQRLAVVEKALHIKVITPSEAQEYNDPLPITATEVDHKSPHINTDLCTVHLQKQTNEQLVLICQKQQQRISEFTPILNKLLRSCHDLQTTLLNKNILNKHDTQIFEPLTDLTDKEIERCIGSFTQ